MDKNMTLEKRIAAELYCYQGKMSVFVDDLQGHTVEVGADEEFETASTIKAFILAALYLQAQRGKAVFVHRNAGVAQSDHVHILKPPVSQNTLWVYYKTTFFPAQDAKAAHRKVPVSGFVLFVY